MNSQTTQVYHEVLKNAENPVKQRDNITIKNPNGTYKKMKVRKHHLTQDELDTLIEESNGKMPNPYKRKGIYKAIVQSYINIGLDEYHSFKTVKEEIKNIMSNYSTYKKPDFWQYFINKQPRNIETGKDVNGRIMQNIEILKRITGYHCYGYKLQQLGVEIRTKYKNGILYSGLFHINT